MYAKLLTMTILLGAIAAGLLVLRQQRAQQVYDLTVQRKTAQELRQDIWRHQSDVAGLLTPRQLNERILIAQLQLEPATPMLPTVGPQTRVAQGPNRDRRTDSP